MRTLVISDLHLGAHGGRDVLRRAGPLRALCEHLKGFDRLVLLGDALELRHGPVRDSLAAAEPVFAALGEALGDGGEVVLVGGNHDHALVGGWLERRGARRAPGPLGLEERGGPRATPATARLAKALEPAAVDVAYPGMWLRDDVYATHGHYLDRLTMIPTFERLGAGAMTKVVGPLPRPRAAPEDFEAALVPMYAWMHALAQSPAGVWAAGRQSTSARAWSALTGSNRRAGVRARAAAALFPLAVAAVNRAGFGPVTANLSGGALRRDGLQAMGEVLVRLGVEAEHVVFGHTHRSGPLDGDDPAEWRVGAVGPRLHNCGCWIDEPVFTAGDPESPYWAGRAIELDDAGPPRLVRVVDDLAQPV